MASLRALAEIVCKGQARFLCGAGMSKASGLQLAEGFARDLISELLFGTAELRADHPQRGAPAEFATRFDLGVIAEAFTDEKDNVRLREFLITHVKNGTGKPHDGHKALAYLAHQGFVDRVYTTNFDDLLEQQLGSSTPIADGNVDDYDRARGRRQIPVIHLHGALPNRCAMAESDLYSDETPTVQLLRADMVTGYFILVGYKLEDPNLRPLFFRIRRMALAFRQERRPYVIVPLESKGHAELEWLLAKRTWHARGATFVPGKAEVFLPALATQVRRTQGDGWAHALIAKQGGDQRNEGELQALWQKARELAGSLGDEIDAMRYMAEEAGIATGTRP